jgi:hypothetical protein
VIFKLGVVGWGLELTITKTKHVMKCYTGASTDSLKQMGNRFGIWNVRTLYRSHSSETVIKRVGKMS